MSSIRPLITITILVAVGVFLFTKINEGPVPLPAEVDAALERAPAMEIPTLSTATNSPTPSWSDPPNRPTDSGSQWAEGASESTAATPPTTPPMNLPTVPAEVPSIPELPPLASVPETQAETVPTPPATQPIPLPANIPVAQYPDDIANDDRYGATQAEPNTITATPTPVATQLPTPTTAPTPTFSAAWPEIKAALDRQELVAAHEMLSRWYGNPNLSPAEAQQVELLLSQLAGTVVYSTEHRLEPPYTVQSGDTLQTIAQKYDVPWQLLAKINGIPATNLVQPGQQLKVVHGPFAAVVELDKRQLTLILDGRYAGRFPISVAPDANVSEGQWVLEQKLVQPTTQESGALSVSYATTAVDRVLVLRNESPAAAGATISITAGPGAPSGPTAVAPSAIRLSPRDVEEVADILSVGSPVVIRR